MDKRRSGFGGELVLGGEFLVDASVEKIVDNIDDAIDDAIGYASSCVNGCVIVNKYWDPKRQ